MISWTFSGGRARKLTAWRVPNSRKIYHETRRETEGSQIRFGHSRGNTGSARDSFFMSGQWRPIRFHVLSLFLSVTFATLSGYFDEHGNESDADFRERVSSARDKHRRRFMARTQVIYNAPREMPVFHVKLPSSPPDRGVQPRRNQLPDQFYAAWVKGQVPPEWSAIISAAAIAMSLSI